LPLSLFFSPKLRVNKQQQKQNSTKELYFYSLFYGAKITFPGVKEGLFDSDRDREDEERRTELRLGVVELPQYYRIEIYRYSPRQKVDTYPYNSS